LAGAEALVRPIYGDQWIQAIPAVRFFCVTAVLGGTSTVLVHALYSLGRADTVFRLGLFWAALTWGLTALLVPRFGFVGFAAASAAVSTTGALTALALRRLVPVQIVRAVRVPLAAGVVSAAFLAVVARAWIRDIPSLLIGGCIASATYIGLACLLGGAPWRAELREDWRRVWGSPS
jgi:O-antigen/teichoic acid export membrane protein